MMRRVGGRFRALDATLSATWFLLASPMMIDYVNAGPGAYMSWLERLPLLAALVCMAISAIFLIEFLLPSPLRRLIESFRNSRGHRVSLLIGLVVTFMVAWRTWVNDIFGSLGESGWLFDLVLYLGAFIWLVLAVQLFVAFVSRRSTIR